jgi:hypothetical protein
MNLKRPRQANQWMVPWTGLDCTLNSGDRKVAEASGAGIGIEKLEKVENTPNLLSSSYSLKKEVPFPFVWLAVFYPNIGGSAQKDKRFFTFLSKSSLYIVLYIQIRMI